MLCIRHRLRQVAEVQATEAHAHTAPVRVHVHAPAQVEEELAVRRRISIPVFRNRYKSDV